MFATTGLNEVASVTRPRPSPWIASRVREFMRLNEVASVTRPRRDAARIAQLTSQGRLNEVASVTRPRLRDASKGLHKG